MGGRISTLLAVSKSEEGGEIGVKYLQCLRMSKGAEIARARPFRSVATSLLELNKEMEACLIELGAECPISYSPEKGLARALAKLEFMMRATNRELQLKHEDGRDLVTLLAIARAGEHISLKDPRLGVADLVMCALDDEFDSELARLEEKSDARVEALLTRHLRAVMASDDSSALPPPSCHIINSLLRGCNIALKSRSFESIGADCSVSDRKTVDLRVTGRFPLMVADLSQFARIIAQVLLHRHPLLYQVATSSGEGLVHLLRRVVLDVCFDFFRRDLYWYSAQMFLQEDASVKRCFRLLHPSNFGVRSVLRLDGTLPAGCEAIEPRKELKTLDAYGDAEEAVFTSGAEQVDEVLQRQKQRHAALASYEDALYLLSSLYTSCRTPSEKLQRLVGVCRRIRQAPVKYYAQRRRAHKKSCEVLDCSGVKWPTPQDLVV